MLKVVCTAAPLLPATKSYSGQLLTYACYSLAILNRKTLSARCVASRLARACTRGGVNHTNGTCAKTAKPLKMVTESYSSKDSWEERISATIVLTPVMTAQLISRCSENLESKKRRELNTRKNKKFSPKLKLENQQEISISKNVYTAVNQIGEI